MPLKKCETQISITVFSNKRYLNVIEEQIKTLIP